MANITLTASAVIAARLATAIGYQATIKDVDGVTDIPNPVSAMNAIKKWLIQVAKDQILRTEANVASQDAVTAKMAEEVDIT